MGPALVGIQLGQPNGFQGLVERMDARNIRYKHLNDQPILFDMLI